MLGGGDRGWKQDLESLEALAWEGQADALVGFSLLHAQTSLRELFNRITHSGLRGFQPQRCSTCVSTSLPSAERVQIRLSPLAPSAWVQSARARLTQSQGYLLPGPQSPRVATA